MLCARWPSQLSRTLAVAMCKSCHDVAGSVGADSQGDLRPLLCLLLCVVQVAFPAELDVYDFCAAELQQQLRAPREAYKNYQDMLAQQKRTAKQLKTEDGPKPGPGAAAAEAAAAGEHPAAAAAAGGDVEMKDAAADAGASSSSGSVVGALTGERMVIRGEGVSGNRKWPPAVQCQHTNAGNTHLIAGNVCSACGPHGGCLVRRKLAQIGQSMLQFNQQMRPCRPS